jgi:hypothetical protein
MKLLIEHRCSSGSIVSDYGMDDRAIGVRTQQGQRIFRLSSVSRPALRPTQPPVQWVPGVLSPGVKRGRGVILTTHPHLVPRSWMSRSYTSSPPSASMACSGTALLYCTFTSLSNFLHSPITSSLLCPNILIRTLFSNTLSLAIFMLSLSPAFRSWPWHVLTFLWIHLPNVVVESLTLLFPTLWSRVQISAPATGYPYWGFS